GFLGRRSWSGGKLPALANAARLGASRSELGSGVRRSEPSSSGSMDRSQPARAGSAVAATPARSKARLDRGVRRVSSFIAMAPLGVEGMIGGTTRLHNVPIHRHFMHR